jgi:tetratricopeptide (TPR) repeat protein
MTARILLCVSLAAACKTVETKPVEHEHEHAAPAAPVLFDDLGSLRHAVQASPQAQAYFDQGLRLMFAFNHEEAIKAFQHAVAIDPKCAMCLWGSALALGPNINLPTDPEREKMAWDLVAKARALGARSNS